MKLRLSWDEFTEAALLTLKMSPGTEMSFIKKHSDGESEVYEYPDIIEINIDTYVKPQY